MSIGRQLNVEVESALGPVEQYPFSPFAFERLAEGYEDAFLVFSQTQWIWTVYVSAVYVFAIFGIQHYMKDKQPMSLRPALAAWSAILGVFSIMGAYRSWQGVFHVIANNSFLHSMCHPGYFEGVAGFWTIAFVVSKPYELGDTIFIVLRKQKLIFLHWYHHITVLMYVWYSYAGHDAPARFCFAVNYTVHAFMYTYYALRAMKIRVPRWVSVGITTMQILQMVFGCGILVYAYYVKQAGVACQISYKSLSIGLIMYLSYLVLFSHFFYVNYVRAKPPAKKID